MDILNIKYVYEDYGDIVYNQVINTFYRIGPVRDAKNSEKTRVDQYVLHSSSCVVRFNIYYVCFMYYNMYNNIAPSTKVL